MASGTLACYRGGQDDLRRGVFDIKFPQETLARKRLEDQSAELFFAMAELCSYISAHTDGIST